jgi:putative copper resistance protein D
METAAPLARLLLYGGTMLAMGQGMRTMLAGRAPAPAPGPSPAVRGALWCGACALLVAPLLLLWLQQQALELPPAELPALLRTTTWGRGWLLLIIPCILSALLLPLRRTGASSRLLVWTALGVSVTMGGLGHAAADAHWPLVSRLLDALHVAGAGAWIGALLLMLLDGAHDPDPTGAGGQGEWQAFSQMATVVAPLVLLSGVGSAWLRVGASGPAEIFASDYGRLLALKLLLALLVVTVGATQRQRLGAGAAPRRQVVLVELCLAAVVFTATAWLTGLEPPGA